MANDLQSRQYELLQQHTRELTERIRLSLKELPEFCEAYFRAISSVQRFDTAELCL